MTEQPDAAQREQADAKWNALVRIHNLYPFGATSQEMESLAYDAGYDAAQAQQAEAVAQARAAERAAIVAWLREEADAGDIDGHTPNAIEGAVLELAADRLAEREGSAPG